ncbi:putative Myb/SANT-like domain-containing protein [Rosa chinensis]|uniref:Putative Myb/SANT-like domain-containing protein n=1 Tax=Rosa chinensis TaxID=74649 RepID=A0A2P6QK27_ROSCH|nr:putative Myb/SANT-like domain-containing protein [Rosa chinensis]
MVTDSRKRDYSIAIRRRLYLLPYNLAKMANKSGIQEKGKATWTDHNVDVFCDLCIKEIEKGSRPGTHLTPKGYENLGINFAKET